MPGTNLGESLSIVYTTFDTSLSLSDKELITLLSMYRAKRKTREQWDKEWGRIDEEGNLWWLGSTRENWISVMGSSKWGWFCKCVSAWLSCHTVDLLPQCLLDTP